MTKVYKSIILLAIFTVSSYALSVDSWPSLLSLPVNQESSDSSKISFKSDFHVFEQNSYSSNIFKIAAKDSLRITTQEFEYKIADNKLLGTQDQYFNLSGGIRQPGTRNKEVLIGVDWKPIVIYNTRPRQSAFQVSSDVGPVIEFKPWGVPLEFHGGVSGKGYNDNLPDGLKDLPSKDVNTDAGIYSGIDFGNEYESIGNLPLYLFVKTYGRLSEKSSRFIAGHTSVLCPLEIMNNDSLYIYYADSVTFGKEGFLDNVTYIHTPSRLSRSLNGGIGLKLLRNQYIIPEFSFFVSQNQVTYQPGSFNSPRDERNTVFSGFGQINTTELFPFGYGVSFKSGLEKHDKLFNRGKMSTVTNGKNNDSLWVNLGDYNVLRIEINQKIEKWLKNGMGAEYSLLLTRISSKYPNFFVSDLDSTDTTKLADDNHWIREQHKARIILLKTKNINIGFSASFLKSTSIYLNKKRSAENSVDRTFGIGALAEYTYKDRLQMSESIRMESEAREYNYPEMYPDIKGPPFSRTFTSDFDTKFKFNKTFSLTFDLDNTYWDGGYWNSKKYSKSSDGEFYAIERTYWEYTAGLTGIFENNKNFNLGVGCNVKDINYRESGKEVKLGVGFIFMPHTELSIKIKDFIEINTNVEYVVHNLFSYDYELTDDEKLDDYWNIKALVKVSF